MQLDLDTEYAEARRQAACYYGDGVPTFFNVHWQMKVEQMEKEHPHLRKEYDERVEHMAKLMNKYNIMKMWRGTDETT